MKIDEIRELAAIMNETGLTAIEIEECGARLKLKRELYAGAPVTVSAAPVQAPAAPAQTAEPQQKDDCGVDFNDVVEIKSPLVGVFYVAPSPDSAPYVKVGDHVKKGDVLCVVEAMKLMRSPRRRTAKSWTYARRTAAWSSTARRCSSCINLRRIQA